MIAAIILVHNEQEHISRCIQSLKFCDELIVIDDNSTDDTIKIVDSLGAKVFKRSLNNDFSAQRNSAFEYSSAEWFLFVDADEVISPALQEEIKKAVTTTENVGYKIPRRDNFWNTKLEYGEVKKAATDGFLRLVRRDSGQWQGDVHEEFISKGPVGHLTAAIEHYPHATITTFIQKINWYSTLRALELQSSKHKASIAKTIVYPFGKFIYTYFILLGFKDGPAGFVYSFMMSFHSFLVRAKLYQYQHIDHENH